jgi:hypothetical protein
MTERTTPFTRDEVIKALTENEYTRVAFYKVDGTLREMICTVNPDELQKLIASDPEVSAAFGGVAHTETERPDHDPNQIPVFDVEKKGWRSFLLTNLITLEGVNQ